VVWLHALFALGSSPITKRQPREHKIEGFAVSTKPSIPNASGKSSFREQSLQTYILYDGRTADIRHKFAVEGVKKVKIESGYYEINAKANKGKEKQTYECDKKSKRSINKP
jgi:hypothetical protein